MRAVLKLNAILIPIIFIITCYSGQGIKLDNNYLTVDMAHYSLSLRNKKQGNLLKGWYINRIGGESEIVNINKKNELFGFELSFQIFQILDENLKQKSISEIADIYRQNEINGMIELGVNKGKYNLSKDINSGNCVIQNKTFYTMRYATFTEQILNYGNLYIHIPNNKNFIFIAHHAETGPNQRYSKNPKLKYKEEFEKLLENIKIKNNI